MIRRLAVVLGLGLLASCSFVFSAQPGLNAAPKEKSARGNEFKDLMRKQLEAWETLDPAKAAHFYAQEADLVFYDLAPMKYTGWPAYAEGVKKLLADVASLKFTLGDDVQVHPRRNFTYTTATLRTDFANKDGSKWSADGRWTLIWEKRGKDWLIVHEHYSVPMPMPEARASQPLYKRLGGYDAIAAVTDDFIGRLAHDPQLAHFFAGHSTDSLGRIRQLVVDQLCNATGGPCIYIGRSMKASHQGLGITENDWKVSVDHLAATLDKFQVPPKEKNEVLSALSGLKADIVNAPK